jgi:hypothetical protein
MGIFEFLGALALPVLGLATRGPTRPTPVMAFLSFSHKPSHITSQSISVSPRDQ